MNILAVIIIVLLIGIVAALIYRPAIFAGAGLHVTRWWHSVEDGLHSGRLLKSCQEQVVIIALIAVMIYILGRSVNWLDFIGFSDATLISVVIWTLILCFTPAFNMWFICPKANYAVVLAKKTGRRTKLATDEELTRVQPNRLMRVVYGPTFDGKSPFEEIVNGTVIDLRSSIVIEDSLEVIVGKVKCTIYYYMSLFVLQSDETIINLAQHSQEKVLKGFKAKAEAYIESTAKPMTVDELFKEIYDDPESGRRITRGHARLNSGFQNLFLGDRRISLFERNMGMGSRDLTIKRIVLDSAFQKALQSREMAVEAAEGIETYARAGVSPDVAANLNAGDRGEPQPARVNRHIFSGIPNGSNVVIGQIEKDK